MLIQTWLTTILLVCSVSAYSAPTLKSDLKGDFPAVMEIKPVKKGSTLNTTSSVERKIHAMASRDQSPGKRQFPHPKIKLGDEVLFENSKYTKILKGKSIGLITNPTGMDSHFVSTIDKIANNPDCKLVALFAPEHGIRGAETAGEAVKNTTDSVTGVPVFSLHGVDKQKKPVNKPTSVTLEGVNMLVYDMQDIGNRSYTFISTMKHCMEAAKENNVPIVILDRPNPMGGNLVDGNVLDPKFQSMVGCAPIAYLYGLTCGELALWFNEHENIHCDLTVVPMKGWKRSMKWWDTGLPWIPTSTHMQHAENCWHIAVTGTLGELNAVNEGVGYPAPFEYVGAPYINSIALADELNSHDLPGIIFRPAYFKPYYHIFKDQLCGGVQLIVLDYDTIRPVEAGMHIMEAINKMYPDQNMLLAKRDNETTVPESRRKMFAKVMGSGTLREELLSGKPAAEITKEWEAPRQKFAEERKKYFLYK